ncbi:MAG: twin-arginine translocation signal domain-containing protein [Thermomicrobiales bacterium]
MSQLEITRRKALGGAAVAAAMLGLNITSNAQAQESQVAATPVALGPAVPPEADVATDWFTENKNFAMDRNAGDSAINASNVGTLELAWSYLTGRSRRLRCPDGQPDRLEWHCLSAGHAEQHPRHRHGFR